MKTETINLYSYDELSEQAKEKVIEDFSQDDLYSWWNEDYESMKEFCKYFPVELKDYRIDFCQKDSRVNIDIDNDVSDFTGIRLMKYIINNYYDALFKRKYLNHVKGKAIYSKIQYDNCCVLTGYCMDNDILQPIYDFLKKPDNHTTLYDLLYECVECWLSACQNALIESYKRENIEDFILANDYTFRENGDLW